MPPPLTVPRFTSCWQDPEVVVTEARRLGTDRVTVVGGTGDLALDLAAVGLQVRAIAPDPDDRALNDLKLTSARLLPAQSVRSFLGLGHFGRRVWFYHHLRGALLPETAAWGDARETWFRLGLLGRGRFERSAERLRNLLRVTTSEGTAWQVYLHLLGSVPVRRRSGLGVSAGPGGPATWMRGRTPATSPWSERLATGAWADPGAAHPWMTPEGLARIKARPPALDREVERLADLVVVPEGAEFYDDARWDELRAACAPGSHVLVWERWRRRDLPQAEEIPISVVDRSPLHARARLWRVSG